MAKSCCCCCDKFTVKKGIWTPEEDEKLIAYVKTFGHWNWRRLPQYAGLLRCGKSCRLRWMNYLRPNIRRGGFSRDEEETIIRMYTTMGGRWSAMASLMSGRTDNDIKNHWNTVLKRQVMKQKMNTKKKSTAMSNPPLQSPPLPPVATTSPSKLIETAETPTVVDADELPAGDQSPASSTGDFWTDPLWLDSNFDTAFDYQYQDFGESNIFNIGFDEYLLEAGIYTI